MKVVVRKLEVEDTETLQALVIENIDGLEPGLTMLDTRLLLGHATIDVVALDANGSFVLIAVAFTADETLLLKAVEAYSWSLEYPDAIHRLYPAARVSDAQPPRVVFVIERMPDAFHRKIKQLGFADVDCVEFRHLEVNGAPAVYFESLARFRRPSLQPVTQPAERPAAPEPVRSAPVVNVIQMSAAPTARATSVKLQKLLHHAEPAVPPAARAVERPAVPAPATSVVTTFKRSLAATVAPRQAETPAEPAVAIAEVALEPTIEPTTRVMLREAVALLEPKVEQAVEPTTRVMLREAVALLEPKVEQAVEPTTRVMLREAVALLEPRVEQAVEPTVEPIHEAPRAVEPTTRVSLREVAALLEPAAPVAAPKIAPGAPKAVEPAVPKPVVPAAPKAAEPRISFAEAAKELLGLVTPPAPAPAPVAVERPAVEEITRAALQELVTEAAESLEPVAAAVVEEAPAAVAEAIVVPEPTEPEMLAEPLAAVAQAPVAQVPVAAAPAPPVPAPPVPAPQAPAAPVKDAARQLLSALPQEFQGMNFPNDGQMTRQWMDFLNQMAGSK